MEILDDDEEADLSGAPWFLLRMMSDEWNFGLLLRDGKVLCITHISRVTLSPRFGNWLKVNLMTAKELDLWIEGLQMSGLWVIAAPTSRTEASVALGEVVAAFELADT